MTPERVKEFIADYHRELDRLVASQEHECAIRQGELARIGRQIRAIIGLHPFLVPILLLGGKVRKPQIA